MSCMPPEHSAPAAARKRSSPRPGAVMLTNMEIGKPQREIVVEPLQPPLPEREQPRQPEREPEKVPAGVPDEG